MRVTLETNCIFDLEQSTSIAAHLQKIIVASLSGKIKICIPAIMASERGKNGKYAENFEEFEEKLRKLGLDASEILLPIGYWDITFWGKSFWGSSDKLETDIHSVLFPQIPFLWPDYCKATGINVDDLNTPAGKKWRNAKCDVLSLWSHIHYADDLFVTSDNNFHKVTKKPKLIPLGAKNIETPESAANIVASF